MGRKELMLIDLGAFTYLQPLPPAWPCSGHTALLAASSFCCPAPALPPARPSCAATRHEQMAFWILMDRGERQQRVRTSQRQTDSEIHSPCRSITL